MRGWDWAVRGAGTFAGTKARPGVPLREGWRAAAGARPKAWCTLPEQTKLTVAVAGLHLPLICRPEDVFWCTADIGWVTGGGTEAPEAGPAVQKSWAHHGCMLCLQRRRLRCQCGPQAPPACCSPCHRAHLCCLWPPAQRLHPGKGAGPCCVHRLAGCGPAGRAAGSTCSACRLHKRVLARSLPQILFEGIPTYPHDGRWWELVDKHQVRPHSMHGMPTQR